MARKTPKDRPELGSILLDDGNKGRIANAFSKAISYERDPEFFDEDYIKDRDKEIKGLQELQEKDTSLPLERRGKPVYLTNVQSRIIHALSYGISQELEAEDVKRKIQNPEERNLLVSRDVSITPLTALIWGSTRKRYKENVIKELFNIAATRQYYFLGEGNNRKKVTAPLIMIGDTLEDLSPEKINDLDFVQVVFGTAFFFELSTRYATISPKLFEVWRKSGRGTELYSTLQSSIFSVYWSCRQAAQKAKEDTIKKYKEGTIKKSDLNEAIAEAKRRALEYSLNVTTIKNRVTTKYDSNPNMKRKFWIDLQNAIDGFKELDLITEAIIHKGAKGQDKVSFILSETYNFIEKDKNALPLLGEGNNKNEPSVF